MRRLLILGLLPVALAPAAARADTPPAAGGVFPLANGCIGQRVIAGDCPSATGHGMTGAAKLAVTPDGHNAYVAGRGAVSAFSIDPAGHLAQLSGAAACVTDPTWFIDADCTAATAPGMGHLVDVVASPDGNNVYSFASNGCNSGLYCSGSVTQFARTAGGALAPLTPACHDDADASSYLGASCGTNDLAGTGGAAAAAMAPDGKNVYVASVTGVDMRIATLQRDANGNLHSTGFPGIDCAQFYNVNGTSCGTSNFLRPASTAGIPQRIVVSPDNRNVYMTTYAPVGLIVLTRHLDAHGSVTQPAGPAGCIGPAAPSQSCDTSQYPGPALAASPDGKWLANGGPGGVTVYRRDPDSGTLTVAGCLSHPAAGGCAAAPPNLTVSDLEFAADSRLLYGGSTSGTVWTMTVDPDTGAPAMLPDPSDCLQDQNGTPFTCSRQTVGTTSISDIALHPTGPFLLAVSHQESGSTPTLAQVAALGINRAPSCTATTASTTVGVPVAVPLTCSDANGHPLTLSVVSGPSSGSLGAIDQAARSAQFTPASVGTVTFTFKASDGGAESAPAIATVTTLPNRTQVAIPANLCGNVTVDLIDVFAQGGRVHLIGFANPRLAGQAVAITSTWDRKTVAHATVGADGYFTARAALPAKKLRKSDKTRYTAKVGASTSPAVKLSRRIYVFSLIRSGANVTITGQIVKPLAKHTTIRVTRRDSCAKGYATLKAKLKLSRSGKFKVTAPAPPASAPGAVYVLRTRVPKTAKGKRTSPTNTLPRVTGH